jgi:hypothetical protein
MESILFLKEIRKKGNTYKDVWINILLQYESNDCPIKLLVPYGMHPSTYHKIVTYGVEVFAMISTKFSMTKSKMQLIISERDENAPPVEKVIKEKKPRKPRQKK